MSNNIEVNYHTTGESTVTNKLGMRQMQERVYAKRNSKYLLVKAPPASGKSRALMFVALDKLANQGIKKVIVAVPERSIGSSFKNTELVKYGFYEDWIIDPYYDLTSAGTSDSKVQRLIKFMEDTEAKVAICTHSTLRNAYQKIDSDKKFDNTLIAIDEFHHVSAEDNSVLGGALKNIMHNSNAHILAMTGSYFRGDSAPILTEEDEREFDKVNYSYYEQLDGYKYLKSFGIDYKFYQGRYTDAIGEAMDLDKKMIIHIPNVNSAESTKDKYDEVDHIFDAIGEIEKKDEETGIYFVRRKTDGKLCRYPGADCGPAAISVGLSALPAGGISGAGAHAVCNAHAAQPGFAGQLLPAGILLHRCRHAAGHRRNRLPALYRQGRTADERKQHQPE